MKNKLIAATLSLILIFSVLTLPLSVSAKENEASDFAGSRYCCLVVDPSDVDNYINGGRSAFDIALRTLSPNWLAYKIFTSGEYLSVTLEFEFTSLEDYKEKCNVLNGKTAPLSYHSNNGDTLYMESFDSTAFLSFVYDALSASAPYSEITLGTLFRPTENCITINGETYYGTDKIQIFPQLQEIEPLRTLMISTVYNYQGYFTRTIEVTPIDLDSLSSIETKFSKVGTPTTEETTVSVSFNAPSLTEICEQTSLCLYATCSIEEKEEKLENLKVGVTQREIFSVEELLPDGGNFTYEFIYPDYYENVSSTEERINVSDGKISSEFTNTIEYYYEREFTFSKIDIATDFSDSMGKITKSITLSAPTSRTVAFHKDLKRYLESFLEKGVTLRIFDIDATRNYQFSFSSWKAEEIENFTKNLLGNGIRTSISDSWFPYGKSTITESVNINQLRILKTPPESATLTYSVGDSASIKSIGGGNHIAKTEGVKTLVCYVSNTEGNIIEYHHFHLLKFIFVGSIVLLITIAAIVIFVLIKKHLKKSSVLAKAPHNSQPEKTTVQASPMITAEISKAKGTPHFASATRSKNTVSFESPATGVSNSQSGALEEIRYCRKCGNPSSKNSAFCKKCGTPFNR